MENKRTVLDTIVLIDKVYWSKMSELEAQVSLEIIAAGLNPFNCEDVKEYWRTRLP